MTKPLSKKAKYVVKSSLIVGMIALIVIALTEDTMVSRYGLLVLIAAIVAVIWAIFE